MTLAHQLIFSRVGCDRPARNKKKTVAHGNGDRQMKDRLAWGGRPLSKVK
jgi:hypothetical protein